jgi:hypothetical protein
LGEVIGVQLSCERSRPQLGHHKDAFARDLRQFLTECNSTTTSTKSYAPKPTLPRTPGQEDS